MTRAHIRMPVASAPRDDGRPIDWPAHPFAKIFPLMEGERFAAFKAGIREKGLVEPIVLYQDMVLDGRNRLAACIATGVTPRYVRFEGSDDDAFDFVWAKNFDRRDLTVGQRAAAAEKRAMLGRGRPPADRSPLDNSAHVPNLRAETQEEAAAAANVSVRAVGQYKRLTRLGVPELVESVDKGETSLRAAEAISQLPKEEQSRLVATADAAVIKKAAKEIRAREQTLRHAERVERNRKIAARQGASPWWKTAAGTEGPWAGSGPSFSIIYADPPWKRVLHSDVTGGEKSAETHYPTMTVEEICDLGCPAAREALLELWTTDLANGLRVMQAWGFEYKSFLGWRKVYPGKQAGTGYWSRDNLEILLIGVRGNFPAPLPGTQPIKCTDHPVLEHSRKPAFFAAEIQRLWPDLTKLEMFQRKESLDPDDARITSGKWQFWGNQAGVPEEEAGAG